MPALPNIVFVSTEDQRFDTIYGLGNRRIHTPNMDWLAQNGAAFTHAFIHGGTSGAACLQTPHPWHSLQTVARRYDHIHDARHLTDIISDAAIDFIFLGGHSFANGELRVPLIFAGPGVLHGLRRDALVYLLDIFCTLCELSGVRQPLSVEGRSLVPLMRGANGRRAFYLAYTDKQRGVRTQHWKLIEYVVAGQHTMTELFDLRDDPWETVNLACSPRHAAIRRRMERAMLRLRDLWDDRRSPWGKTFWRGYA